MHIIRRFASATLLLLVATAAAAQSPNTAALVVSVVIVSIAPPPMAVSAVMPLPVSVPAPPIVPASSAALRSPQATSARATMEARIQDVRFMGMSFPTAEPPGSPPRLSGVFDSGFVPLCTLPKAHVKRPGRGPT